MSNELLTFLKQTKEKSKDLKLINAIKHNTESHVASVERGKEQFSDLESLKRLAKNRKWDAIDNLEKYLLEFETNFISRGGKVIWAEDAEHAFEEIHHILKRSHSANVLNSKSIISKEIDLDRKLEGHGINLINTEVDLHSTFAKEESKELRNQIPRADASITGADFIIADTGSICITENAGNKSMSYAWPKVLISIIGIENILPSATDLNIFWPLLSTYSTGDKISTYNTLISGPSKHKEEESLELYVVLLDNGRTKLLADAKKREALYCIKCDACLNVCPVYTNIGENSYGTTYSGPIGAVISPAISGEEFNHLSQASTTCGKCSEVCPVNIPLHNLILKNRSDTTYDAGGLDKMAWKSWEMAVMSRKMMNQSTTAKNIMLKSFFKKAWGEKRELPKIKPSFNQQWKNKYG